MPKFTSRERTLIQNIVASLSIKRIPDQEIIKEVYEQTKKTVTEKTIYNIRQRIKKDSYHWYKTMREGQYDYIHEFRERISEIMYLQKRHHTILDSDTEPTAIKQNSLAELHRLNITLSNYFDVAPDIIGHTVPAPSKAKATNREATTRNIIV
jgi:hypothetical protein